MTVAEFHPFCLGEHSHLSCRRLHFPGSTLSLACLAMRLLTGRPQTLLCGLLCGCGYGCDWVGRITL